MELEDFLLVFFANLKAHGITPLHQSTPETLQIAKKKKKIRQARLSGGKVNKNILTFLCTQTAAPAAVGP